MAETPDLGSAARTLLSTLEERLSTWAPGREPTIFSATAPLSGIADPAAAVFASRLASDRWFCWEQPDRDLALAALGTAAEARSRGPDRFRDVAAACAASGRRTVAEIPAEAPPGSGPAWVGGFAFDPDGGDVGAWSSFPPALMTLPELSLAGSGGEAWATLNLAVGAAEDRDSALTRATRRLAGLRAAQLPLLDPHPASRPSIRSSRQPHEFESAVAEATGRIRAGALEKVVLAREVVVESASAHDVGALFGALRELFPSCFCFCVGTPEAAFVGASPELLVRRAGAGLSTVALAGSARRSSDPAVDDHLGERLLHSEKERTEHAIVARRIVRALRPHAVWVSSSGDPELIKVANIQHLATAIHAQLAEPRSAVEMAGLLHPTPAVGGEPWPEAADLIAELEQMDRGWYASPVGWMDAAEDGEFCVALRSALLRDREAHLYAGGGVVGESDPAAELAETEIKLEALLPLLGG